MDSDTESEGDFIPSAAITSDAPFVLRQPQATSDLNVLDAIGVLVATAPRATSLGSDPNLHTNVVAASSSLNCLLDDLLRADVRERLDICASFELFLELLREDFFVSLFTHRRAVYSILRTLGDTSSISVPWTDVLLLKMCRIVNLISSGYAPVAASTQLLDAQALWAVRQLPQDTKDLAPATYSTYASPGMRKLALQLVFAACIVRPAMTGDLGPSSITITPTDIESVARYYGDIAARRAGGLGDDEKLSCAMATVLCATVSMDRASDSPSPTSRPYFISLIFGCLHALFDVGRLTLLGDDPLDPAQLVILSWGHVLPWCWRCCADPRSADMTLVSSLTTAWLRHQSRGATDDGWKSTTLDLLMRDLPLSATHILQLLYRIIDTLHNEEQAHHEGVTRLAHQVCWSMAQLSDPLLEGRIMFFPDTVLHLCTMFLHFIGGAETALNVAESALQALLHAEPSDVRTAAERLAESLDFPTALDRAVTTIRKLLAHPSGRVRPRPAQMLLAFVTVFGHRGATLPHYKPTMTMLSSAVSDHVCAGVQSSRELAVSLAISAPYLGAGGRTLSEEEVLSILYPEQPQDASSSSALDLLCAAAVSSYLLCSSSALQSMSALLKAEVWDFLRDALTLTIERRFVGEDEAMSVLVAHLIGRALSRLRGCSDTVFVEHAAESSWTSSLRSQRDALVKSDSPQDDYVRKELRARLAPDEELIFHLAQESHKSYQDNDQAGFGTQLVFHSFADSVFLIPVLLHDA
ncbi:unnamed protein product [Peniophora sp. CBMAI 1063]|nr:unnamed protein product [Peniophora sp. CBMAI 1063]